MAKKEAIEELPVDEGPRMAKKVNGITKEAALEVLVEENPKRAGSKAYDVFAIYLETNPTNVQEALDAGIGMDHLKYDFMHGSINIEGAEVEEYEVKPRGPRAEVEEVEAADGDGF